MIRSIVLAVCVFAVAPATSAGPKDDSMARGVAGAKALKGAQKDPTSFALEQLLVMGDGASCYTYRSKNSFGGVVPGQAVLVGGRIATHRDESFPGLWRKHCENKSGQNITSAAKRMI